MKKKSTDAIERLSAGNLPLDYNWNAAAYNAIQKNKFAFSLLPSPSQAIATQINCEGLRDGLGGVEVMPSVAERIEYLNLAYQLGIKRFTVGIFSGTNNKIDRDIKNLLKRMRQNFKTITPIILSLATEDSLRWAGECKEINPNLEVLLFMGTAPSRLLAENWNQDFVLHQLDWAIKLAISKYGLDVIGATEHTTQTPPDFLKEILRVQVNAGIKSFCIADTTGRATPEGTFYLVSTIKNILKELNAPNLVLEWHGHNDIGNATPDALAAVSAGATCIHTVVGGIGERAGNTALETILINLYEILKFHQQPIPWKMSLLEQVITKYYDIVEIDRPRHGCMGTNAFDTQLGLHSSAISKLQSLAEEARLKNYQNLAKNLTYMSRTIYTAYDPELVGRKINILVGPWSGKKNVFLRVQQLCGLDVAKSLSIDQIEGLLRYAKALGRILTDSEIKAYIVNNH